VTVHTIPTFAERQEERDQLARYDGAMGNPARRWTTCQCGETSPEFVYYGEVDHWEAWHDCPIVRRLAERTWNEDIEDWTFPRPVDFEHHIEPFEGFHVTAKVETEAEDYRAPVYRLGVRTNKFYLPPTSGDAA
jgi:hypothetical protein